MEKQEWYRKLPKVDVLLEQEEIKTLIQIYSRNLVIHNIRKELEILRTWIKSVDSKELQDIPQIETYFLTIIIQKTQKATEDLHCLHMKPVINATGTILHTNLGRAPLSELHMEQVARVATGYSNLEYNLAEGKRGERYVHFEELLCEITGAEAAMAVNNNAAAVMLILNAIGREKEVIVSRGELVEVGGKFRIPDVMEISRARLVEVGTTNKTHIGDYEDHIGLDTAALLKVHTSNYQIVGFTQSVPVEELVQLGREKQVPVIEDLGSGVLIDLSKYGLAYEPTVQESIRKGVDMVCFSGDKLLGGPQAGIILGKKVYIDQMKKNPLTRALRIDKFTAAALEVVLREYLSEEKAVKNIPILEMMTKTQEEINQDARLLWEMLGETKLAEKVAFRIEPCESQIGGGSLPLERLESMAIVLKPNHMSVTAFEGKMREQELPIIGRVMKQEIWMDVRTLDKKNFIDICKELEGI